MLIDIIDMPILSHPPSRAAGTHAAVSDWRQLSDDELIRKIRQFLIATTLKDCSVMVNLQRVPQEYVEARMRDTRISFLLNVFKLVNVELASMMSWGSSCTIKRPTAGIR